VEKVERGSIVLAKVCDRQGRNAKPRPLVIVTSTEECRSQESVVAVAITGTLPRPLPDDHVLLPWQHQGHSKTGLKKKCAAVCTWLEEIRKSDIEKVIGIIPQDQLLLILEKLHLQD
jgi:mRNA-degrading endonuclease toxin of MazEF toxin-antitoxin module